MEELEAIMQKFAASGWDLIAVPAQEWLDGKADALYPEAEIVDLTLNAKDGAITITDRTNNKTYSGTYEVQQKTPKGTDYEIIINGVSGYATVSPTEYYDGSEIPTLPININGYSLYFIPEKA